MSASTSSSREAKSQNKAVQAEIKSLLDDSKAKKEEEGIPALPRKKKTGILNADIKPGGILKWLYDANPFYLISTCLILYAQTVIFNTGNIDLNTAIAVGIIAAYTLLLAGAALFIIRFGKVWNDLRSLMLIITVLIFFLSASLDRIVLDGLKTGLLWQGGGLLLSLGIAYALYRQLGIRLNRLLLIVPSVIMGLFFFYPSLPAFLVNNHVGNPVPAIRSILLFPVITGILFLFLIPAVRQGKAVVIKNPTPWTWPGCPWIVPGILWLCAAFRTYLLTISFYGGKGVGPYVRLETGFSFYMLIPLVLAACVLFAEYGIANGRRWIQTAALAGPALFFLMAMPFVHAPRPYYLFLEAVLGKNGSPFIYALSAAGIFYVYALLRRIRYAEISLAAVLILIIALRNDALQVISPSLIPSWLPAALTIAVLLLAALIRRNLQRTFISLLGIILVLTLQFKDTWFTNYHGAVPFNLILLGTMVIMNCYRDRFCEFLRKLFAVILPLLGFAALYFCWRDPWYLASSYIAMLAVLGAVQIFVFNEHSYTVGELINIAFLFIYLCHAGLQVLSKFQLRGLRIALWGLIFFAVAFVLSMIKGGIPQRVLHRLRNNIDH
jgi:hypothetical protein